MTTSKAKLALIYDFDGTLCDGVMIDPLLENELGINDAKEFWHKSNRLAKDQGVDRVCAYMYLLLKEAKKKQVKITKALLKKCGSRLKMRDGLTQKDGWFASAKKIGKEHDLDVENYVITSGLTEVVKGCKVAKQFKAVFGSSFYYDKDGVAVWPARSVNYTTKTQYLFRINKGELDESDEDAPNKYMNTKQRPIPFSNMVFFGDGMTDVPCFSLLKKNDGHAIAVLHSTDSKHALKTIEKLVADGRVDRVSLVDHFVKNGMLLDCVKQIASNLALAKKSLAVTLGLFFASIFVAPTATAVDYELKHLNEVMRGYIEIARKEEQRVGTLRLFRVGTELKDAKVLRDAMFSAVAIREYDLASRIGTEWFAISGDSEALALKTRIHISKEGLDQAVGLVGKLAEAGGPEAVFKVLNEVKGKRSEVMKASHPISRRDEEFYAYLALLQVGEKDIQAAIKSLEEGLKKHPHSDKLLIVRVLIADALRDEISSITTAEALVAATETNINAVVSVYEHWAYLHSKGTAPLPKLEDYFVEKDKLHVANLRAGVFYFSRGDPGKAITKLKEVRHNSPSWGDAVKYQVAAYKILEDDSAIRKLFDFEIQNAADEFVAELSTLYARYIEEVDGAEDAYKFTSSLDRGKQDPEVLIIKSFFAEKVDKLDEAEAALREYIKIQPDSSEGYNALGYLFANHNINLTEALDLIEQALAISPNSAAIIDSHGWVLYRLGDLKGARISLEKSIQLQPNSPHPEIMAHYGEVLWELGEEDAAVRVWQSVWQEENSDPILLETVKKYFETTKPGF